jgi:hypothetical protein
MQTTYEEMEEMVPSMFEVKAGSGSARMHKPTRDMSSG